MGYRVILIAIVVSIIIGTCKKQDEKETSIETNNDSITFEKGVSEIDSSTFHKDTAYEYEYRIGKSSDYQYNYDVSGEDENGNEITGNVTVDGKYGNGILTNFDGEELEVEVEWIDYGVLKATDINGNEYELKTD
jgi:hypothetical protein